MTLHALVFAVAALMHRGTPPAQVADAIETACTEEASRAPVDVAACASLLAVYSARESSWQLDAVGDSGRSCGPLQMPCAMTRRMTLVQQYETWLRWIRESSLGAVDSSPRRAARRVALASQLLERAQDGW